MKSESTRKKRVFQVNVEGGAAFACPSDEKVLMAMEQNGVAAIDVGCRGGGCGACRIEILHGEYETLPMSKKHVTDAEAGQGFALACRVVPKSDLQVRLAPHPKSAVKAGEPSQPIAQTA